MVMDKSGFVNARKAGIAIAKGEDLLHKYHR